MIEHNEFEVRIITECCDRQNATTAVQHKQLAATLMECRSYIYIYIYMYLPREVISVGLETLRIAKNVLIRQLLSENIETVT